MDHNRAQYMGGDDQEEPYGSHRGNGHNRFDEADPSEINPQFEDVQLSDRENLENDQRQEQSVDNNQRNRPVSEEVVNIRLTKSEK